MVVVSYTVGTARITAGETTEGRVMLRKITVLLAALAMMMVMSMPVAMAHHQVGHVNSGHKLDDNADHDQGGGNNHIKQNHGGGND